MDIQRNPEGKATIRFFRALLSALPILLIAGCDDSVPGNSLSAPEAPLLLSYSIEGNGVDEGLLPFLGGGSDPSVIDSGRDDGQFSVNWEVENDNDYVIDLYLTKVDGDHPITFFQSNCGLTSTTCGRAATVHCTFLKDNRISCSDHGGQDLTNWLDTLPETVVMGLHVHGGGAGSGQAQTIELR